MNVYVLFQNEEHKYIFSKDKDISSLRIILPCREIDLLTMISASLKLLVPVTIYSSYEMSLSSQKINEGKKKHFYFDKNGIIFIHYSIRNKIIKYLQHNQSRSIHNFNELYLFLTEILQ